MNGTPIAAQPGPTAQRHPIKKGRIALPDGTVQEIHRTLTFDIVVRDEAIRQYLN